MKNIKRPTRAERLRRKRIMIILLTAAISVVTILVSLILLYRHRHIDEESKQLCSQYEDSKRREDSIQAALDSMTMADSIYYYPTEIKEIISSYLPRYSDVNLWSSDTTFKDRNNVWLAEYFTYEDGKKQYYMSMFDHTDRFISRDGKVRPQSKRGKGVLRSYVSISEPLMVYNIYGDSVVSLYNGEVSTKWYRSSRLNKVEATEPLPTKSRKDPPKEYYDDYDEEEEDYYEENMEDWYFYHNRK